MRSWLVAACAGVAALAVSSAARAQSCAEAIETFARQYALATELPRAEPPSGAVERPATEDSRGVPPESLSRSGGVIAPPGEGRGRVIEPPRTDGDGMRTAPPMPPQTSQAPSTGNTEIGAARRAQMQGLLDGARAAERQGNEAECRDRLDEARRIPQAR